MSVEESFVVILTCLKNVTEVHLNDLKMHTSQGTVSINHFMLHTREIGSLWKNANYTIACVDF